MESTKMIRRVVGFQKTAFDNTFDAMKIYQDQTENMTRTFMNQAFWIPEEGRKTMDFWMQALKKGRDEFKKAVDETCNNIDTMIQKVETAAESRAK